MSAGIKTNASQRVILPKEYKKLSKRFYKSRYLLLLMLPCLLYYIIFCYLPMWGVLLAFKDYKPFIGFFASKWVGLKYFYMFFQSTYMFKLIGNTFLLGLYSIVFEFPIPIILALVLYEVKNLKFKKFIQTITYMPHFLSVVVIVGIIQLVLSPTYGIVNTVIQNMGFAKINFLQDASYFRAIYIISDIWTEMGWGAIIYLAALSGIDPTLYEAAFTDGANKFHKMIYITLPSLAPTIIIILLLNMGNLLNVGFEKVFLLQNPAIYSTADVIQTYVYRQGLAMGNFSYGTAIGLFNTVINLFFLIISNTLARRFSETSLY